MTILKPEDLPASPVVFTIANSGLSDEGHRRYWLEFYERPGRRWYPNATSVATIAQCRTYPFPMAVVLVWKMTYNPVTKKSSETIQAAPPGVWYATLDQPAPAFNILFSEDEHAR
jgi:hypothetical protein